MVREEMEDVNEFKYLSVFADNPQATQGWESMEN